MKACKEIATLIVLKILVEAGNIDLPRTRKELCGEFCEALEEDSSKSGNPEINENSILRGDDNCIQ